MEIITFTMQYPPLPSISLVGKGKFLYMTENASLIDYESQKYKLTSFSKFSNEEIFVNDLETSSSLTF